MACSMIKGSNGHVLACSQLKVTVRDSANLLEPDTLTLDLLPGPPAQLAVEGPPLECGTRVTIPQLRVRVCDEAGNPTTSESFEVR